MSPTRDTARERNMLGVDHGHVAFVDHAQQRLAVGEEQYGDRWTSADISELLTELLEEAADLGAWGVLADQELDTEHLSSLQKQQIRSVLALAIRRGAQAHEALTIALRSLR